MSFTYNTRKQLQQQQQPIDVIPTNAIIFKKRFDMTWCDVLRNFQQNKSQLNNKQIIQTPQTNKTNKTDQLSNQTATM